MDREPLAESSNPGRSVFDRMRSDHRNALARIDALQVDSDRIGRMDGRDETTEQAVRDTLDHLEQQFRTHMRAEDDVIFSILEDAIPTARQSIAPLRQEHDDLRGMLRDLNATLARPAGRARNEQVAVQGQDFADLLRIHIRKEESVVFSVAERMLNPQELAQISARLTHSQGASGK
jgi:hemerythrin-like domain-containing protein